MDVETTFLDRLFHQFDESPNITALVAILSDALQDTNDVETFILSHTGIDTAEGEQLDLLGQLIGVYRPPRQEEWVFTLCHLGETDDLWNHHGFFDDSDPTVDLGGYVTTTRGLDSISDPGNMSDADYRKLIRQKAASYRKKMTQEILFNYLIESGARCKIDDTTTTYTVTIDPYRYYDIDEWRMNYIVTKGFKPAGIKVEFMDNVREPDL
ncbi:DUF2612 domain-containing protein [Candidatus Magnetobacterium casense]|uniref:DUF2612 domain-containing protein n=1 Tax=Candidatus Magnetobacterium casense TaxID=1455061 RepID=A0ABS6RWH8_9BACT|nr:DUF2612 domain-containing protein [Candidatus Magnetobacterium casensis]MBV6340978.1 DUF2612 domain-containing protein [Candidatus Magnetobacterium casensis]